MGIDQNLTKMIKKDQTRSRYKTYYTLNGTKLFEDTSFIVLTDRFYHLYPHAEGSNDAVEYAHAGCVDAILNF